MSYSKAYHFKGTLRIHNFNATSSNIGCISEIRFIYRRPYYPPALQQDGCQMTITVQYVSMRSMCRQQWLILLIRNAVYFGCLRNSLSLWISIYWTCLHRWCKIYASSEYDIAAAVVLHASGSPVPPGHSWQSRGGIVSSVHPSLRFFSAHWIGTARWA